MMTPLEQKLRRKFTRKKQKKKGKLSDVLVFEA